MNIDVAGVRDELLRRRATRESQPIEIAGLRYQDMRDIMRLRVVENGGGGVLAGQRHRNAAEARCELQNFGDAIALGLVGAQVTRRLDMERGPWRAKMSAKRRARRTKAAPPTAPSIATSRRRPLATVPQSRANAYNRPSAHRPVAPCGARQARAGPSDCRAEK